MLRLSMRRPAIPNGRFAPRLGKDKGKKGNKRLKELSPRFSKSVAVLEMRLKCISSKRIAVGCSALLGVAFVFHRNDDLSSGMSFTKIPERFGYLT